MDDCKRFKDLLLTDYLDAQIDPKTKEQIDAHLRMCPECRLFAQEAERDLVTPFKNVQPEEVPVHLWTAIQERLQKETSVSERIRNLMGRWVESSFFQRLAPV